MKITRISRIRGYRLFRDYSWPVDGLPDFGRYNLIFGWNGTGKTTLSGLFSYLQKKQPVTEGDVQFLIDANAVNGGDLDTAALPPVRVFNRDTVNRVVFENPAHELPPIYVLGEDSAEKQEEINKLKDNIATLKQQEAKLRDHKSTQEASFETWCSDRAQAIKNLLTAPGGGRYNNYNKADFKRTADKLLSANPEPMPLSAEEREKFVAAKGGRPLEKLSPPSIDYPDLHSLTKGVGGILEKCVLSHALEELVTDPLVSVWVGQGLALHTGEHSSDTCRFCKQPLPPDRLSRLQDHFNDEFQRFSRDIDGLISKVASAKATFAAFKPPSKGLLYPHLVKEYEKNVGEHSTQSFMVNVYLDALDAALRAKSNEPFRALELHHFLTNKSPPEQQPGTLETIFQIITTGFSHISAKLGRNACVRISAIIDEHNRYTDNYAAEVERSRVCLEDDEVLQSLDEIRRRKGDIQSAGSDLSAVSDSIRAIGDEIAKLERDIRSHRKTADELNKEMAAYLGRDELRFEPRDTGYAISRNGEPAVHLSEGERTAVAFMYFLKSLSGEDFDTKNGIVVIDDPVSSLDANSLYSAFGFMKSRTQNIGQLFVLTHNFTFFRQVKNWFNYIEKLNGRKPVPSKLKHVRFYMMRPHVVDGTRSAHITVLDDLLHEYESEYHYLFRTVYETAHNGAGAPLKDYYVLPNTGRRLLETVLAFKRPEKSGELYQQLLGVDGFDEAKKARIIRFTNTYSHNGQIDDPEHDLSVLAETPEILRDVLALVEYVDPDHYRGMVQSVAPQAGAAGGD